MINLVMKNHKFRRAIKYKLLIAKFMLATGVVHPVKHEPHIHAERHRFVKQPSYNSLIK